MRVNSFAAFLNSRDCTPKDLNCSGQNRTSKIRSKSWEKPHRTVRSNHNGRLRIVKTKLQLTVSDDILRELGKAVVFQAQLESMIGHYIGRLLSLPSHQAQIVTAELSFKNLIGLLSSILIERLGEASELHSDFKAIKKGLYAFEAFRNNVAHSIWVHSEGFDPLKATRMKTTSKERNGLRHQREEVELQHIITAIDEASDCDMRLALFIAKVTDEPISLINTA